MTSLLTRMTKAETTMASLGESVKNLVSNIDTKFEHLESGQERLRAAIQTIAAPKWSVWIGFTSLAVAVIVAFFGLVGGYYWRDFNRMEQKLTERERAAITDAYQEGKKDQKMEDINHMLSELDVKLQNEMKLMGDVRDARFSELDIRIRRDIEQIGRKIDALENSQLVEIKSMLNYRVGLENRLGRLEATVMGRSADVAQSPLNNGPK